MKGSMLYLNFQSDPENIYIYIYHWTSCRNVVKGYFEYFKAMRCGLYAKGEKNVKKY